MKKYSIHITIVSLILLGVMGIIVSLWVGSVSITFAEFLSPDFTTKVIIENRVIRAFTAILAGIALPVSGMLLQEYFKNVLAGPSVLGISSSAGLGVALVVFLGVPGFFSQIDYLQSLPMVIAGLIGAMVGLLLISLVSLRLKDASHFIIIGFLLSAFAAAIVSFLQLFSENNELKQFVVWSFGSFSGLSFYQLILFAILVIIGMLFALKAVKLLQGNILGESYALSVGVNLKQMKFWVLIATSILTGVTTSFLGPIAFVGIVIPFFCRMIYSSSKLLIQLILNILVGIIVMLGLNILTQIFTLPINVLTSILGIPMIVFILLKTAKNE